MNMLLNKLKNEKKFKIILWGFIVHILLVCACFDIYFASPLDHGMTPVKSTANPPAKRVVLFVADGLRAESIYGDNIEDRSPFLTNIRKTNGVWGISHTRVPTESRPGHVALLGGIYEDPSAVFRGWKANPVDFDSVFNQSTNAWLWGSPDICNIFNKDKVPYIHVSVYGSEMEDFGKRNSDVLDTWVFKKVEDFLLNQIQNCKSNCDQYYASGNIFFLHLLGIDTAGHGYKPHSNEYINNIKLVDENVGKIFQLFEDTFQDKSTAYVFTSDHGMTDWGSHGAGTPHETEAPVIAWGPGIRLNSNRQDVKQIDLAPFLAALIGINIPINSLGIIPKQYLDLSDENLAAVLLANTFQLIETFNIKRVRTEQNSLIYFPFQGITDTVLKEKIQNLKFLFNNKMYGELNLECEKLMETVLKGLNYYHNYYQKPILITITIGLLSWIFLLAISIVTVGKEITILTDYKYKNICLSIFISTLLITVALCYKQKFPLTYYLYFVFPSVLLFLSTEERNSIKYLFNQLKNMGLKNLTFNVSFYLIAIELLVFGFFYRWSYSLVMLLVGCSILISDSLKKYSSTQEKILWIFCSIILAIFPMLPVMKTFFNVPVYILGFLIWLLLFNEIYSNRLKLYINSQQSQFEFKVFFIQFVCLILSGIYVLLLEYEVFSAESSTKYLSWFLLIIPLALIPFTSKYIIVRLSATFFGFAPFYLLVSPNFEVLFSAVYVAMLFLWLVVESKVFQQGDTTNLLFYSKFDLFKKKERFQADSIRRAFMFMVFFLIGFFGTGNIASINAFDPMWVRAFLTVFSPFKMMALILLKFIVPFIFASCVFRAINAVGKENILSMFCIILIFSDIMVLQFLYLVTNEGSWLDIGSSLSHFIIMEVFVIILLLLYGCAQLLTTVTYKSLQDKYNNAINKEIDYTL